jgi:hypothetical protein
LKKSSKEVPETTEICHGASPMVIGDERFQNFMTEAANIIQETMQTEDKVEDVNQFSQIDPNGQLDTTTDASLDMPDNFASIDDLTEDQLKELTMDIRVLLHDDTPQPKTVNSTKSSLFRIRKTIPRQRFKREIAKISHIGRSGEVVRINYRNK